MNPSTNILLTFAGALFFGIVFITISNRLKISPIVLLLIGGIIIGPSSFGLNIIQPDLLGDGLIVIIQASVGLILFEGGLTLDSTGYRTVSSEIRRALTGGVIITWLLSGFIIHSIFSFDWQFSLLASSLIIVTGPTVIGPLLKRISVNERIHDFLHWEGVLIDPIGVFIALLCYEWIIGHNAIELFIGRLAEGVIFGVIGGLLLSYIISLEWIPDDKINTFIIASALAIFTFSDLIIKESGLLSVTIAGFVVGYKETPQIARLKIYKSQLIELLIGLLFILLAGNLDIESFNKHYGPLMALTIGCIIFIVRPVNILFSTFGKTFNIKEKLFLSWIAPRGIVAASMASLFALNLQSYEGSEYAHQADFLEAFTYAIICGTVIVQGFSAPWIARLLKVRLKKPTGWLILGAHIPGQIVARFIKDSGFSAVLMDANIQRVRDAQKKGFKAICDNALTAQPEDYADLYSVGNIMAITVNQELNELICQSWKRKMHGPNCYLWHTTGTSSESEATRSQRISGTPIWAHVPLRDIIARFDSGNSFSIYTSQWDGDRLENPEGVLMSMTKEGLLPGMPEKTETTLTYLAYIPFPIIEGLPIQPGWIKYSDATTLPDVLDELLQSLHIDYPEAETGKILSDLLKVQSEMSCVIGYNVCLTHTYTQSLDQSCALFAKLKEPINCSQSDDTIAYIFLVLSPKDMPDEHIHTLSEISHFLVSEQNRDKIQKAKSTKELRNAFFHKDIRPVLQEDE